jgi:hypothetical protein
MDEHDGQEVVHTPIDHLFATWQQQGIRRHGDVSQLAPHIRVHPAEEATDTRANLVRKVADRLQVI